MARQSSRARADAAFRAGGSYPKPPKTLGKRSRVIWTEITHSKPVDWFDPGSLGLLARYCTLLAYAEAVERHVAAFADGGPMSDDVAVAVAEARKTSATLTTLATKLRLSVQAAVDRRSRKLDEGGVGTVGDVAPALRLIGGKATA